MKTFFRVLLLWPFILTGFIATYRTYKKSNSSLTYREWAGEAAERWVEAGRPRGRALEFVTND